MLVIDQQNQVAISNNAGAPAGHTGSPFDNKTCAKSGCHLGSAVVPTPGIITSTVPVNGYIPGTTYAITCSVGQTGINEYGFQISPMNNSGTLLGSLIITNPTTTKIVSTKYVTHTLAGTGGVGGKSWSFNWVAPGAGTGSVTFYGAFNFTNSSNSASGDVIHTSTLIIPEDLSAGINGISNNIQEVKISPNPFTDHFSIAYQLANAGEVVISLSDLKGNVVERVERGLQMPGKHVMELFPESSVKAGIYLITIQTPEGQLTKKAIKL